MNCNATHPGHALRPGFTPLTVGLTILGFIIAWPLGLAMLAYIFWGHRLPGFVNGLKDGFRREAGAWTGPNARNRFGGASGNAAFDEYRRIELERLEAERRRLDEERREFEAYMRDLRRARDQEEFDRFMAERRRRQGPEAA